jgi:hypothetical protein
MSHAWHVGRQISAAKLLAFLLPITMALSLSGQPEQPRQVEITKGVTVSFPAPWFIANRTRNAVEIAYPLQNERAAKPKQGEKPESAEQLISAEARIAVSWEQRRSHADAVARLVQIALEEQEQPQLVVIAGWPAIHRERKANLPNPGETEAPINAISIFVTTAIAMDTQVVRFETVLAPDADPKLAQAALKIAQGAAVKAGDAKAAQSDLQSIAKSISAARSKSQSSIPIGSSSSKTEESKIGPAPQRGGGKSLPGTAHVQNGVGELEVAVSDDGQHVVVAANSGHSHSDDGGLTFTADGGTPCIFHGCDGDPSLAVGKSGAFYYAWIGFPTGEPGGIPPDGATDSLSISTDNGHTFSFLSNAVVCPSSTPASCTTPDQEHIAADRIALSASSKDRVYLVWRNFSSVSLTARIVCSSDGGSTWSAQTTVDAAGDFSRVNVGGDSFVYVAYRSGGNIMLHKFSACDSGLTPQPGFPVTVAAFTSVPCPMPGLDRCNNGNILSSPTVAADDLNPSHIYVAWANSSGAGNENIMVADSMDGGATFPRSVQVNGAPVARRFMPWISTYGGVAYVNWYDRRNATAANNDLTRYFGGSAAVKGGSLVAGSEADISQVNDPHCSNWLCAPRSTTDSESCSIQPQLAGVCGHSPPVAGDSHARCDFSAGGCPGTESCLTGGGCPKYGDYNGGAAISGRRYAAWSSFTPPPGVTGAAAGINVYEATDVLPTDFFVRDWTNSATNHDTGSEPSTNPVFYETSDVWNQSTTTPEAPVNDWVLGDPPDRGGSNFAFARVSRRAPAAPTVPATSVTVDFLSADFGLGVPFADLGSEVVSFAATDLTQITPALSWSVAPTASTHLCLAVQITAPGDAFIPPTLVGNSPGPADPLILQDNNKAQRNLQTTVGTGTAGTEFYAIIHNIEKVTRTMNLQYTVDPQNMRSFAGGVVRIGSQIVRLEKSGRIVIPKMAPGENRWLGLSLGQFTGTEGSRAVVRFTEVGNGGPVSGFSIAAERRSLPETIRYVLKTQADVLTRLAAITRYAPAGDLAKETAQLTKEKSVDPKPYQELAARRYEALHSTLSQLFAQNPKTTAVLSSAQADPFGLQSQLALFKRMVDSRNFEGMVVAHEAFLQRLDAYLTWRQKK